MDDFMMEFLSMDDQPMERTNSANIGLDIYGGSSTIKINRDIHVLKEGDDIRSNLDSIICVRDEEKDVFVTAGGDRRIRLVDAEEDKFHKVLKVETAEKHCLVWWKDDFFLFVESGVYNYQVVCVSVKKPYEKRLVMDFNQIEPKRIMILSREIIGVLESDSYCSTLFIVKFNGNHGDVVKKVNFDFGTKDTITVSKKFPFSFYHTLIQMREGYYPIVRTSFSLTRGIVNQRFEKHDFHTSVISTFVTSSSDEFLVICGMKKDMLDNQKSLFCIYNTNPSLKHSNYRFITIEGFGSPSWVHIYAGKYIFGVFDYERICVYDLAKILRLFSDWPYPSDEEKDERKLTIEGESVLLKRGIGPSFRIKQNEVQSVAVREVGSTVVLYAPYKSDLQFECITIEGLDVMDSEYDEDMLERIQHLLGRFSEMYGIKDSKKIVILPKKLFLTVPYFC